MADIFDEVSEELKQDQLIQFWKKYSKYFISIALVSIISFLGYFFYNQWKQKTLENSSSQYFSAIKKLENKEFESSLEDFSKGINENNRGYKILSLFGLAEANFKLGKINEMILNYETIYNNQDIDIYYRDLARLLTVMKNNTRPFDEQINILQPILNSPSKLQLLASELKILLMIKFNKIDDAKESIDQLLSRSEISFEQKNRLDLIKKVYGLNAS
jgi:hypothetical protein